MKFKYLIITAATTLLLASCLKSKDKFGLQADNGTIVSEIYDVNLYGDTKVLALNNTPAVENVDLLTLKFYAARDAKPGSDIKLHFDTSDYAVKAAGLTPFPAGSLSIPSYDITIPKGTVPGEIALPIVLTKTNLNLSLQYGIGVNLKTVSEGVISANAKSIVVAVVIKNPYDANYTTTGFFFHPTAGSGRTMAATKHLATIGAASCQAPLADLAGYYFNFTVSGTNTTGWTPVGNTPTGTQSGFFTADNPGNVPYAAVGGALPGTAPTVQTTYNNSYNAATKTFYFHYGYGSTATDQTGWTRNIYEKWVRQ